MLRFENGAKGVLHASQISVGEENGLKIRVYGEKGGLEWTQIEPNTLWVKWTDKPTEMYRTGTGYSVFTPSAAAHTRIPAGHPEGYLEAFANIYRNFAYAVRCFWNQTEADPILADFPSVEDGLRGMQFILKVVESSNSDQKWIKMF